MNKIDGKALALEHQKKIKIERLNPPHIVSFFNIKDQSSVIFTRLKQQKAAELGIVFDPIEINPKVRVDILATIVEGFNKDPNSHGIMFQLPLPKHLQKGQDYLLGLIKSKKDIDGLTGRGPFLPATVRGVLSIISYQLTTNNYIYAVVGSKGFIGKSMVKVLKDKGYEVVELDQGDNLADLQKADVVISCVGKKNLVTGEYIKKGAVLIDVGLGDFAKSALDKSSAYTPKTGGVGPMTIISLMENVVEAT